MNIVVNKYTREVIYVSLKTDIVPNGIHVGEMIISNPDEYLEVIENVEGALVGVQCFDNGVLYDNPNYKIPDPISSKLEELDQAKVEIDSRLLEAEKVLDLANLPIPDDVEGYRDYKKTELQRLYKQELYSGFTTTALAPTYDTVEFYSDDVADRRIKEMELKLRLYPEENSIPWRTKAGWITLTREQYFAVLRDYGKHKETLEYKLTYANAYIENATTKSEIDSIVANW